MQVFQGTLTRITQVFGVDLDMTMLMTITLGFHLVQRGLRITLGGFDHISRRLLTGLQRSAAVVGTNDVDDGAFGARELGHVILTLACDRTLGVRHTLVGIFEVFGGSRTGITKNLCRSLDMTLTTAIATGTGDISGITSMTGHREHRQLGASRRRSTTKVSTLHRNETVLRADRSRLLPLACWLGGMDWIAAITDLQIFGSVCTWITLDFGACFNRTGLLATTVLPGNVQRGTTLTLEVELRHIYSRCQANRRAGTTPMGSNYFHNMCLGTTKLSRATSASSYHRGRNTFMAHGEGLDLLRTRITKVFCDSMHGAMSLSVAPALDIPGWESHTGGFGIL
jgi:hypothetical protein